MPEPRIEVDLDAISHNVAELRRIVGVPVLAVIKANAYGHGTLAVARAALAGGADALGVVDIAEGLRLRAAGIDGPILSWMHSPTTDWIAAIEADIDVGVSSIEQIELLGAAAAFADRPARIHIKVDTGLSRNGAHERDWGAMFASIHEISARGHGVFAGLFSHFAGTSSESDHRQIDAFERARVAAAARGVTPERCHLGASAGALDYPEARYDMVRLGIAMYGLTPYAPDTQPAADLRPALRLVAPIVRDATGARVELGTVDGLPPLDAHAAACIRLVDDLGRRWRLGPVGTVATCVEPIAPEAGRESRLEGAAQPEDESQPGREQGAENGMTDAPGRVATEVTLIGTGTDGDASGADHWAATAGTIGYEIVTRLVARLDRRDAATGVPVPQSPVRPPRKARGLLAPRRSLTIDVETLLAALHEQAAGGHGEFDVSADAYGLGLGVVAPLAGTAGLDLVVRTGADAERAAAVGFMTRVDPTASDASREAYGFEGTGCTRLVTELVHVKRVAAGAGVSYGHEFVATGPTTLGLVPLGYADALPRRMTGHTSMRVDAESPFDSSAPREAAHFPLVGRVAMDQVVLDLGDTEAWTGAVVVVFGHEPGDPRLADVAAWAGVEPCAFVAALGPRIQRVPIGVVS